MEQARMIRATLKGNDLVDTLTKGGAINDDDVTGCRLFVGYAQGEPVVLGSITLDAWYQMNDEQRREASSLMWSRIIKEFRCIPT